MAYQDASGQRVSGVEGAEVSSLALGLAMFAALLMMLMGAFHIVVGLAAAIDGTFYAVRPNFALEMDVSAWGWMNLIGGSLMILVAIGLIAGATVARMLTILIAGISVMWNFYSIPYYPVWSVTMMVFAIGVIWALVAHGSSLDALDET